MQQMNLVEKNRETSSELTQTEREMEHWKVEVEAYKEKSAAYSKSIQSMAKDASNLQLLLSEATSRAECSEVESMRWKEEMEIIRQHYDDLKIRFDTAGRKISELETEILSLLSQEAYDKTQMREYETQIKEQAKLVRILEGKLNESKEYQVSILSILEKERTAMDDSKVRERKLEKDLAGLQDLLAREHSSVAEAMNKQVTFIMLDP